MRVAAYRRRSKKSLLATFVSIAEAARILNIDPVDIAGSISGKHKMAWALGGPQRRLGALYFREIDESHEGRC